MSILFADICGFTPLTTTLSVSKLVETLNDLFGKFDEAAEVRTTSALACDSRDADERRKISCATMLEKTRKLGWVSYIGACINYVRVRTMRREGS